MTTQIVRQLDLPGRVTPTGWKLPSSLDEVDWIKYGKYLCAVEGALQWWVGDWWAYGVEREYGDGAELAQRVGIDYGTVRTYAWVCGCYELSIRVDNVSFSHHRLVADHPPRERTRWLRMAAREGLTVSELRRRIQQSNNEARTRAIEFNAAELGKYSLIYADPPWRYENPPMGSVTRAVENHYPTMTFEDIAALPVSEIVHDDAIMFLWATPPLLMKTAAIISAWGFEYKTNAVWVKHAIGMGFYFRLRHEHLLVCSRGAMPCPPESARQDSVIESPRRQHSEKPPVVYDIIELMYPEVRKIELFARSRRQGWNSWGNQVEAVTVHDNDIIVEAAE
jgi:N6-adenosine-specific RNA methylase IME4